MAAMTRRQERRRRLRDWLLIVAAGLIVAILAYRTAPSGGALALVTIVAALLVAHPRMIASRGVPILTYHSVGCDPGWLPWSREIAVHPETFERHLATLRAMGCTVIDTTALVALRTAGRDVPRNAVALHFDDGYLDNWLHAAPALRRHAMPATFFASLDFIAPDGALRGPDSGEQGYMRWAELAALDRDPLFSVEPHGVDHGRVAISDRVVDRLTAANWRRHAWVQWAATPGPKHDWFRLAAPVAVPIGAAVRESALALAALRWVDGAREGQAAFEGRIADHLGRCRRDFADRLGRPPTLFCWPENAVGAEGRRIAATLGYRATTAGRGRNTASEPADILSRLHAGDRALGVRWLPAEGLWMRASVRLWQGNHYWYPLVAAMSVVRRLVMRLHDRP
jgi:hypothetical protein